MLTGDQHPGLYVLYFFFFKKEPGKQKINGQLCNVWRLEYKEYKKTNTYTMWVSHYNNYPVRYEMMGYESLFGTHHYDKYIIDYSHFKTAFIPETQFEPPASECTYFYELYFSHICSLPVYQEYTSELLNIATHDYVIINDMTKQTCD